MDSNFPDSLYLKVCECVQKTSPLQGRNSLSNQYYYDDELFQLQIMTNPFGESSLSEADTQF